MSDLDALLAEARSIWGDRRMTLPEIAVALGVVSGDISRQARAQQEGGQPDMAEVAKELGNLMLAVRWAGDLGLSIEECISRALEAQRRYLEEHQ